MMARTHRLFQPSSSFHPPRFRLPFLAHTSSGSRKQATSERYGPVTAQKQ